MQRIQLIKDWLSTELQVEIKSFEPASADASFRRYFRLTCHNSVFGESSDLSFIVMDAPPEKESIDDFIEIDNALEKTGVHVPHLYEVNKTLGCIVMSDLGDRSYLSEFKTSVHSDRVDKLYADALSALVLMQLGMQQHISSLPKALPNYDSQRLRDEMNLLPEWYAKVHCQQAFDSAQKGIFAEAMDLLVDSAVAQPSVFVHRDYHSRNLMCFPQHNPAVIDFQDAVMGPITYDLVSLLRDSYIAWPDDKVYQWVEQYRQMLLRENLLAQDDPIEFVRWFDWMGIQRQLKVVGIFFRLNYRDGKSHYLDDIPQTLDYLYRVCARYSEFIPLLGLLKSLDQGNNKAQDSLSQ